MFAHIGRNWTIYIIIFAAVVSISLGSSGWNAWMATSLIRTWGFLRAISARLLA
ncbi:MAG: hypothetical protein WDM79_19000 [Terricaulis sp.]